MGKAKTIRVLPVALASWRSAFAAFQNMKALFVMITVILIALTFLETNMLAKLFLGENDSWHFLLPSVVIVVFATMDAIILAPLAIAVHRFVLLGEVASNDKPLGDFRRYRRFVAYAAALIFVTRIPTLQTGLEWSISLGRDEFLPAAFQIAGFVLPIVILAIFLNTIILFPAIAVGAPGAGIRNAFSDSWLHLWRVLLVVVCTTIPLFAVQFVLMEWFLFSFYSSQSLFFFAVTKAVPYVAWTAVLAATASYIYACYARHLGRPPDLPGKTLA